MAPRTSIVVMVDSEDPAVRRAGTELTSRLKLPLAADASLPPDQLALTLTDQRLELRDQQSRRKGVFADFGSIDPRTRAGRASRSQPLARALGKDVRTVVDATAGLGHDAALLALLGYDVIALERSPIIAALCEDGLRRALADADLGPRLRDRLRIVHADAREYLPTMRPKPDAVYIDPMFPPKRKASALAKKSIRLVRQVVGDDPDAAELVAIARAVARQRVVVKRPSYAEPLAPNPTMSYEGTLVRYDVYRT
jgi:16S rRNA (guanine1516-N2)-methyltransferase